MPADEAQPMVPPHSYPYPNSRLLHAPNMAEEVSQYTWQGPGRQKKSKGASLASDVPFLHHNADMRAEQKTAPVQQKQPSLPAANFRDQVPWHSIGRGSSLAGASSALGPAEAMSAEEKAKASRDRNREHARNTRLRKKVNCPGGRQVLGHTPR